MRSARARRLAAGLAALAASLLAAAPAAAHPLAPSLLELRERAGGRVDVRFRTPRLQRPGAVPVPELPARCRALGAPALATDAAGATLRWQTDCGVGGLRGASLGVRGLAESGTDALLRIELADGELVRVVLRPGAERFVVPRQAARPSVVRDYLRMGVAHLLGGLDHLLFVTGLVLWLRRPRRLLVAVTGFTLGHSVTLSLATLGLLRVPPAPVEVGIAASLLWLAARLAADAGGTARPAHPGRLTAALGLLHGLGFAGALAQAGLPAGEIPLALVSFNLGIELGQLAAVAALLALLAALRRLRPDAPGRLASLPAYAIGTLAAALVFERVFAAWL
jgi:hydrogenase/urease accessory protein HupE